MGVMLPHFFVVPEHGQWSAHVPFKTQLVTVAGVKPNHLRRLSHFQPQPNLAKLRSFSGVKLKN